MVLDAGVDGLGVQWGDKGGHHIYVRVRRPLGSTVISPGSSISRGCICHGNASGDRYVCRSPEQLSLWSLKWAVGESVLSRCLYMG